MQRLSVLGSRLQPADNGEGIALPHEAVAADVLDLQAPTQFVVTLAGVDFGPTF